jgi:hypothetical protein
MGVSFHYGGAVLLVVVVLVVVVLVVLVGGQPAAMQSAKDGNGPLYVQLKHGVWVQTGLRQGPGQPAAQYHGGGVVVVEVVVVEVVVVEVVVVELVVVDGGVRQPVEADSQAAPS